MANRGTTSELCVVVTPCLPETVLLRRTFQKFLSQTKDTYTLQIYITYIVVVFIKFILKFLVNMLYNEKHLID